MDENSEMIDGMHIVRIPCPGPIRILSSRTGKPFFVPLHPQFERIREQAPFELVAYLPAKFVENGVILPETPLDLMDHKIESRMPSVEIQPVPFPHPTAPYPLP